jgi:hypothetical protein
MERRRVFGLVAAGALAGPRPMQAARGQEQADCPQSHQEWLAELMKRVLTIKPGMTRKALQAIFQTEGGLSTRAKRTYVFQDCPTFKVDVDFKPVEGSDQDAEGAWQDENDEDVIVKISAPYLGYAIMD